MDNDQTIPKLFLVDVFSIIANDGYDILKVLLNHNSPIQTKELILKTGIPESKFYGVIKSLEKFRLVERTVNEDRSVFYNVSSIGQRLYGLSDGTLNEIREAFKGSESVLKKTIENKYRRPYQNSDRSMGHKSSSALN